MSDQLLINNFSQLRESFTDFFPHSKQTKIEQLNSITLLSLYISVLLSLYHGNVAWMLLFISVAIFVKINYKNIPIEKLSPPEIKQADLADDLVDNAICTKPTLENPFMNFTTQDYMNLDDDGKIIDRSPACDPNDPEIKQEIDQKFNNNLYKDVSDVFGKSNSQRQFFTMPYTTAPNDPENEFGKWLYNASATCKTDNDYCLKYEDIRAKRMVFPDANKNPSVSK